MSGSRHQAGCNNRLGPPAPAEAGRNRLRTVEAVAFSPALVSIRNSHAAASGDEIAS